MTRAKQRTAVGLLAVVAVAAAALLAVFGLPYGSSNPEAFAHVYTAPNGNTTQLHIDADMTTPCAAPYDATVAVGSVYQVGVCLESYVPNSVNNFQLRVYYDGTLNSSPNLDCAGTDPKCLDANPDANQGTLATQLGSGSGASSWDCTGLGIAPPVGEDPSTPGVADAFIVCNASLGAPSQTLAVDPGLLATISFTALAPGVETVDFGPIDATNASNVQSPRPGGGVARCGTGVPADFIGCFGATITKAYPPDVKVTKTCTPSVLVGDPITCNVTVTNQGTGAALGVGLLDGEVGGTSLNFVSYSIAPLGPACMLVTGVGGGLGCNLGTMNPGDTYNVTLNLTAAGAGSNVNGAQATVGAGLPNTNPADLVSTAVVNEFLPNINVTKLDVSGGGSSPLNGVTMSLYNGTCTGTPIATGVTAGAGVKSFNALAAGTYCVQETLPSSAWGRQDCTTHAAITDLTQTVTMTAPVQPNYNISFCNALLVASQAYDKGASADPTVVYLPAGGSATIKVSEVIYVVDAGTSPTIINGWSATATGNARIDWVPVSGDSEDAWEGSDPTMFDTLVFSTTPVSNGDEFTVSRNIVVSCIGAGGGDVNFALQVGAANSPPVSLASMHVNCETAGLTKSPASANLWICKGVDCIDINGPINGRGQLVINEYLSGIGADSLGAGAFEFDVVYNSSLFDVSVAPTSWLSAGGTRTVDCSATIINENDIHFACVSSGTGPGPTTSDIIATVTLTPKSDLWEQSELTPGQQNGIVSVISDTNCEVANTLGDPISGSLPGGQLPSCGNSTVTVRILEGDLNLDCAVNVLDEQLEAFRYGATWGNLLYSPWYDLQPALKDGDIDIKDLQKVWGRQGSNCSAPIPAQAPQ